MQINVVALEDRSRGAPLVDEARAMVARVSAVVRQVEGLVARVLA